MKICVYRPGALGDLIVTGPAIEAMRIQWPDLNLTLIASPSWSALAGKARFLSADDPALLPLFSGKSPMRRDWIVQGGFDLAILFLQRPDPLLEQGFGTVASRVLTVRSRPPAGYAKNIRDFLFEEVQAALNLSVSRPPSRWPLLPEGVGDLRTESNPAMLWLHAGSGSSRKNWPPENYYSLAREFARSGYCILWSLGPAEEGLAQGLAKLQQDSGSVFWIRSQRDWQTWKAIQETSYDRSRTVAPGDGNSGSAAPVRKEGLHALLQVDLAQLISFLQECSFFIGNDSGVGHLAAGLGIPTLTVFGSSDSVVWAPQGPGNGVRTLGSAEGFPDLADVLELARKMVQ
ncbi:MAG: glycosyltransferase family 9 protein [Leptospiraceae bacterium]|nr:glycosyltransferase family 9 protein [Leptospiraceae bacterium]